VAVCALLLLVTLNESPGAVLGDEIVLDPQPEMALSEDTVVEIPEGTGVEGLADQLASAGAINSAERFTLLARLMSVTGLLGSGRYTLDEGMTTLEILKRLTAAGTGTEEIVVTIPEGLRLGEIAEILEDSNLGFTAEEFLEAVDNAELPAGLAEDFPGGSKEGYLFPDTYFFDPLLSTPEDTAARLIATLDERFTTEMREQARDELGLNPHEVLTLASIVEREAQVPEERGLIARVYINRVNLGWHLQADPTVQFAVSRIPGSIAEFGYWKHPMDVTDYELEDPYNTYYEPGIPPGPIANSGLASIEAILEPEEGGYLFFVAKNDCSGEHLFSFSIEEHDVNVAANPPNPECQ
jgi:UPF0755 protein